MQLATQNGHQTRNRRKFKLTRDDIVPLIKDGWKGMTVEGIAAKNGLTESQVNSALNSHAAGVQTIRTLKREGYSMKETIEYLLPEEEKPVDIKEAIEALEAALAKIKRAL